jgi:hypothetical protein
MIKIIQIENAELFEYGREILELFKVCFEKNLETSLWNWAYLGNPTGVPKISLALDSNKVVGHYAMIPLPFVEGKMKNIGYLSMTTMVHPNYRKFGLFTELAEATYSMADNHSFVFGFPNSNSAPGFKKRLAWEVKDEFKIVSISSRVLGKHLEDQLPFSGARLDLDHERFLKWRVSKPRCSYTQGIDTISKNSKDGIDVLSLQASPSEILEWPDVTVNYLTQNVELISSASLVKSYPFGYRNFSSEFELENIQPNLLMSDVF